jgi:precorrin-4/cobalt-precorrin-4 C11-methyltransferase
VLPGPGPLGEADVVLYPGTRRTARPLLPHAELVDTQDLDLDAIVARLVVAQQAGCRSSAVTRGNRCGEIVRNVRD